MSIAPQLYQRRIPDRWRGHFDMLHDQRRNAAYAFWVQQESDRLAHSTDLSRDKDKILWCDIGTGSGFLGCLAARNSNNIVVSFETVPQLASRARETICKNDCMESNVVWLTHSTLLDGTFLNENFGRRAQFLVSELLDTCLLGEGLVESIRHARECLLLQKGNRGEVDDSVNIIPRYARVLMQAWSGDVLRDMYGYKISNLRRGLGLVAPASVLNCVGPSSGATIHAAPLLDHAKAVSEIEVAFTFDMLHLDDAVPAIPGTPVFDNLSTGGVEKQVSFRSFGEGGRVDAYIMWWECGMDSSFSHSADTDGLMGDDSGLDRDVYISTSPFDRHRSPPPDHWRQCVFFRSGADEAVHSDGDTWGLTCSCDESDIWVSSAGSLSMSAPTDVCVLTGAKRPRVSADDCGAGKSPPRPICTCGHHAINSCFRLKFLNSDIYYSFVKETTNETIAHLMRNVANSVPTHCVVFGDSPLLLTHLAKAIQNKLSKLKQTLPIISKVVYISCVCSSSIAIHCCKDFLMANCQLQEREDDRVSPNTTNHFDKNDSPSFHGETYIGGVKVLYNISSINSSSSSGENSNEKPPVQSELFQPSNEAGCHSSKDQVLVLAEPYFSTMQCEWGLEHVLTLWQSMWAMQQSRQHSHYFYPGDPASPVEESAVRLMSPRVVNIYMSLFSCAELWKHIMAEVDVVEGVDVSSMNKLLDTPVVGGERRCLDSIPLNQWGGLLVGCCDGDNSVLPLQLLGSINIAECPNLKLDSGAIWESCGSIQLPAHIDDIVATNVGNIGCAAANDGTYKTSEIDAIHGVAFWIDMNPTTDGKQSNICLLEPIGGMYGICCFEEPLSLEAREHKVNSERGGRRQRIHLAGHVDDAFEFSVGLIPPSMI